MSHQPDDYSVACIVPMGVELAPVKAMLDQVHPALALGRNLNSYILGSMSGHNIVTAVMPGVGNNEAARMATQLMNDFPAVQLGLLVGIGGGIPDSDDGEDEYDIRLGDVVVSKPTNRFGGVVQYDLGKHLPGGFEQTGMLNKPPAVLRSAMEQLAAEHRIKGSQIPIHLSTMLQNFPAMQEEYSNPGKAQDRLFKANYLHQGGRSCRNCDSAWIVPRKDRQSTSPKIHYGTIGSANAVVKDSMLRDSLRQTMKVICVEMEAAGVIDSFPCLVIRGICDYADSHKNKVWQPYAAAVAAAYMKELLSFIPTNDVVPAGSISKKGSIQNYSCGLHLFNAPVMNDEFFVGREDQLEDLNRLLCNDTKYGDRKVVTLVGLGGVGKTQLSIAFARRRRSLFSSIFWLNAASESTVKESFRSIAGRIRSLGQTGKSHESIDDENLCSFVMEWLSEIENTSWLLIFDNYDDPDLYELASFYPQAWHGSILISTRLADTIRGKQILLESFVNVEESVQILRARSKRDISTDDMYARRLAQRLQGLPLALATAGSYLRKHFLSFKEYLQAYETSWDLDPRRPLHLSEYRGRTLYTTWNLSYQRLVREDPDAAQVLKLLAYFDNQSIWYDLLHDGVHDNLPQWLLNATASQVNFGNVMSRLVDYCFIELHCDSRSYSLHACVHDWALEELNRIVDQDLFWYAVNCICYPTGRVKEEFDLGSVDYARFVPHAARLAIGRFGEGDIIKDRARDDLESLFKVSLLLYSQDKSSQAEVLAERVLSAQRDPPGSESLLMIRALSMTAALRTSEAPGDAIRLLRQTQSANERTPGPLQNSIVLSTTNDLGAAYVNQNQLDAAKNAYLQTLVAFTAMSNPSNHCVQVYYAALEGIARIMLQESKLEAAENLLNQALAEQETLWGRQHAIVLDAVLMLASLKETQNKLDEAEQLYLRALSVERMHLAPHHRLTLSTAERLIRLYQAQGDEEKAMAVVSNHLA